MNRRYVLIAIHLLRTTDTAYVYLVTLIRLGVQLQGLIAVNIPETLVVVRYDRTVVDEDALVKLVKAHLGKQVVCIGHIKLK